MTAVAVESSTKPTQAEIRLLLDMLNGIHNDVRTLLGSVKKESTNR